MCSLSIQLLWTLEGARVARAPMAKSAGITCPQEGSGRTYGQHFRGDVISGYMLENRPRRGVRKAAKESSNSPSPDIGKTEKHKFRQLIQCDKQIKKNIPRKF